MTQAQVAFKAVRKQTSCAYCGVGCGLDIELHNGKPVSLQGAPSHPANQGRACVKGSHLLDTLGSHNRLLLPEIANKQVSWEDAIEHVAKTFSQTIDTYGPESVALYVSGQLLTEDYYVANKLMKGYIGSANIDTNSRLCMSSAVAAYKRAFGEDVVPCNYEDLEQCDVLFLIGSNAAWTHPVLFQRMQAAKQTNTAMKLVVLDPRKTATAEMADLHLPLKPGTDAAFFVGLLSYLVKHNKLDSEFINNHTQDFQQAIRLANDWDIGKVATYCQVSAFTLTKAYQWFAQNDKVVSFYSMGINQSNSGVDKCNAIINCHLATGKIGKSGSGPFSITGQPNAMGGREVGGLSNQLAAHLDIDNPTHQQHVQHFWQSPKMATKAGASATQIIDKIESGHIKAIWIMATNPVVSLPDGNKVINALKKCDLVVVSDCVDSNDTLDFADVKLPATSWLEKDGTVTNSERTISRQRSMIAAEGEAKHDWKIICEVAKAMGFSGFDYQHPQQIFAEFCQLTAVNQQSNRLFDISALASNDIPSYDAMLPTQWPLTKQRPFSDGKFAFANGKARFIAVQPILPTLSNKCVSDPNLQNQKLGSDTHLASLSLVLNSGRVRDQWHTMTRTSRASKLNQHTNKPQLSLSRLDAKRLGIHKGDWLKASSVVGEVILTTELADDITEGQCFMPIHWSRQFASQANASNVYETVLDPISLQPQTKQVLVNVEKVEFSQMLQLNIDKAYAKQIKPAQFAYFHKSLQQDFVHFTFALGSGEGQGSEIIKSMLGTRMQWFSLLSSQLGYQRLVGEMNGKLVVTLDCVELAKQPRLADFNAKWLNTLFTAPRLAANDKVKLLTGQVSEEFAKGDLVCSCFQVHQKDIEQAVATGCDSVELLGKKLKCGTGCGSCKPEIGKIITSNPKFDIGVDIEREYEIAHSYEINHSYEITREKC